uniref:Uncharacterized protein n=1 Tax=Accipiter nisus TaxID=211598 RepID=A0A8B9RSQ2_9AVES
MWRGAVARVLRRGGTGNSRSVSGTAAVVEFRRRLEKELEDIRGAGTWKSERIISSRQGPHLRLEGGGSGGYGTAGSGFWLSLPVRGLCFSFSSARDPQFLRQ